MSLYTADELDALRDCQEAFMDDTCQIGTVSRTASTTGELIEAAPTYGSATVCGFEAKGGQERNEFRTEQGTVVYADAKLRLPHGTTVGPRYLVKLTKRHGTAITPVIYEVMGKPLEGTTGVVCYLRQVST